MWDPAAYLDFADLRARPFRDLLGRVDAREPRRVIDLGCGPGNLTEELAVRWPEAVLEAIDSAPEMVSAAQQRGIDARVCGVDEWVPEPDTDVAVCNAVLQWVPGRRELLQRWVGQLPSDAWLAVQIPGNFDEPSHILVTELATEPEWRDELDGVGLHQADSVDNAERYAELLASSGCLVDAWSTTYVHRLSGADPVLDWISGTALRPIKAALTPERWERFRAALAPRLREAYPPRRDGSTWFAFRRIFFVARTPGARTSE